MENIYNDLVYKAMSNVKLSMRHYVEDNPLKNTVSFYNMLLGMGLYKIAYKDGDHNYQAVVDGIHKCYEDSKDERIKKAYNDALLFMAKYSNAPVFLQKSYDIIEYELRKEKRNDAAFKADVKPALQRLAQTVEENYSKLSMAKINFNEWYNEMDKNLQEKYGETIKK